MFPSRRAIRRGLQILFSVPFVVILGCQPAPTGGGAGASAPPATSAPKTTASGPAPTQATASAAAPAKAPLEKSTLNVGNVRLAALSAIYVADRLGYFKDEGLTINFRDLGGGAEGVPALQSGTLDISHSPYVTLLQARERGLDLVALVTNNASPSQPPHEAAVLSRKDDASITSLKSLEGKTVAVNSLKSVQWLMTVGAIRKAGADDKKVKFVEAPPEALVDGLNNRLWDAAATNEPFTSVALQSGKDNLLSYPYIDVAPGLDIGAYVSTRAFAEKNPNTVAAFARGLKKAHAYLMENLDRARQQLGEASNTPPDVVKNVVLPVWTQQANVPSLQTLVDLALEYEFIKNRTTVDDFLWPTAR